MTTKENIIVYKNRIKNEIDNLDPSEKDDYLISECLNFEYYRRNNYMSSESEQEMKSLLEYDRIVLVLEDRMEQERIIKKAEKARKTKKELFYFWSRQLAPGVIFVLMAMLIVNF